MALPNEDWRENLRDIRRQQDQERLSRREIEERARNFLATAGEIVVSCPESELNDFRQDLQSGKHLWNEKIAALAQETGCKSEEVERFLNSLAEGLRAAARESEKVDEVAQQVFQLFKNRPGSLQLFLGVQKSLAKVVVVSTLCALQTDLFLHIVTAKQILQVTILSVQAALAKPEFMRASESIVIR